LFDANIFYPHTGTLAYSEANLGAGALAVPVYWATNNPYAAHNYVVLLAFLLSGVGTYYLVRHLTGDRRGAVVAAICFAFCPYVFAHLAHIQLLMTAGLPFSMLAFHRIVEPRSIRTILGDQDVPTPRTTLVALDPAPSAAIADAISTSERVTNAIAVRMRSPDILTSRSMPRPR